MLKQGRTVDKFGLVAELVTKAADCLAVPLTKVLNAIFREGSFPEVSALGMIVTLYKGKGDQSDPNNYRGITIIPILAKIYATALNCRLTKFRLANNERKADGQAGFLPDHRTTDHLFTLTHLIHKYTRSQNTHRRLYTCFIDLTKAFDTVDRNKLWERLDYIGIRGNMLAALKGYYCNVAECVKTNEGLSDQFASHIGVKQGCPLSPTLFGLFIDEVDNAIREHMDQRTSIRVGGNRTPLLLYADDIVLLGSSEWELQRLMDGFKSFCLRQGLTVNISKTKVVVFCGNAEGGSPPPTEIWYNGSRIEVIEDYKYLGITFHWKLGALKGGKVMLQTAQRALFAMRTRARAQQITDPRLLLRLYESLVLPIAYYGCEVWGLNDSLRTEVDRLHMRFLRQIMKVPNGTSRICVLAESNRPLPSHSIIKRAARYWDRLATIDSPRLLLDVATENFEWVSKCEPYDTKWWGCRLLQLIERTGATINRANISRAPPLLEQPSVTSATQNLIAHALDRSIALGAQDHRDFYRSPTYVHAKGERLRTYAQYFWLNGDPSTISNVFFYKKLVAFRLGKHGLGVLHREGPTIRRADMTCKHCNMDIIEDEAHFLLECPLYTNLRSQFHTLFSPLNMAGPHQLCLCLQGDISLITLFATADQTKLAAFISACLALRRNHEHALT